MTCIGCPLGCTLTVRLMDGAVQEVTGNSCKRGEEYALEECSNPIRIVTTSIPLSDGRMLSVKTEQGIPKALIIPCMRALKGLQIEAPVRLGEVVVRDVAGTGINVIATRDVA